MGLMPMKVREVIRLLEGASPSRGSLEILLVSCLLRDLLCFKYGSALPGHIAVRAP